MWHPCAGELIDVESKHSVVSLLVHVTRIGSASTQLGGDNGGREDWIRCKKVKISGKQLLKTCLIQTGHLLCQCLNESMCTLVKIEVLRKYQIFNI